MRLELDACPHVLSIFIYWVYTQELVLGDYRPGPLQNKLCVFVYALAEKLSTPVLRRECYCFIREHCRALSSYPGLALLQIVVERCSAHCMLRKYFVPRFAHCVTKGRIHKKSLSNISPEFSVEVTDFVKKSEGAPAFPFEAFEIDDSNSEYNPTIDPDDASSELDPECMMDISEDDTNASDTEERLSKKRN